MQKVLLKQDLFWSYRELPMLQKSATLDPNPLRRENSVLYKHWLHGAERFLKQSQRGYTPTSRSRYSSNYARDFGRRRLRFPASGRRRRSYDSMLHAFVKKVSPGQFRRSSVLRFAKARPKSSGDFRETLLTTAVSAVLHRQRLLARKLSASSTFSRAWRALLSYRVAEPICAVKTPSSFAKRRFAALPTSAVFKYLLRNSLNSHRTLPYAMRVARAGILRRALRRRRRERVFVDLRLAALHRRAPRERATRP